MNGKATATNGHTYGKDVIFTCNHGYRLEGDFWTRCQANGSWSKRVPNCVGTLFNNSIKYTTIAKNLPISSKDLQSFTLQSELHYN